MWFFNENTSFNILWLHYKDLVRWVLDFPCGFLNIQRHCISGHYSAEPGAPQYTHDSLVVLIEILARPHLPIGNHTVPGRSFHYFPYSANCLVEIFIFERLPLKNHHFTWGQRNDVKTVRHNAGVVSGDFNSLCVGRRTGSAKSIW